MDIRFPFSPAEVAKVRMVQFGILSPDEIRQMSVVQIEHGETTERGKPKVAGLSDPRLGTIDRKLKCETCTASMAEMSWPFWSLGACQANVSHWVFEDSVDYNALCLLQLL